MEENTNVVKAVEEIKGADEESLKKLIEDWLERTRTQGMKIGATYVAAAVYGAIEKNLKKNTQPSLRDYQRAIKRIIEIVSVQLKQDETQQNDSKEVVEEKTNDE
jgi:predicted GTPase